jgi:transposase
MNDYIFFLPPMGEEASPTWFNKWETKKRKLKNIKPPN